MRPMRVDCTGLTTNHMGVRRLAAMGTTSGTETDIGSLDRAWPEAGDSVSVDHFTCPNGGTALFCEAASPLPCVQS